MFGYVAANPKYMTEQETLRYRSLYCGLCRCLGERHGQLSRLSLTYDMTFLALFLGGMYEPEEREEKFWCAVHPKGKHDAVITSYTEYAADMNVLLAYLNCMDNWKDDRNVLALLESRLFHKGYLTAVERYPRQTETIGREMAELARLEAEGCTNADLPAACFGRLLGELFVPHERDHFAEDLRRFGYFLGKFVYLYDAIMDFEDDRRNGSYNPFCMDGRTAMDEETAREMLSMYISECVRAFERLPIVQDSAIIKGILLSGVWTAFRRKYGDGNRSLRE